MTRKKQLTRVGTQDDTIPLLISMTFHDTGIANVKGMSFELYLRYAVKR